MATAVIAVAAAVGGGLAGSAAAAGVSGYLASIAVGAIAGAVVGGAISAVGAVITGQDVGKSFKSGLISGGLAGAMGGFVTANAAAGAPASGAGGNAAAGAPASGAGGNAAVGAQASGAGVPLKASQAGLLQKQPVFNAISGAPIKAGATAANPTVAGGAGVAPVEAGATAANPTVAGGAGVAGQSTQQAGLLSGLGKIMPKSEFGKFALLSAGGNALGSVYQGMSEDKRAAEAERLAEEKQQELNTSLSKAASMSPPMRFGFKDNELFFSPSYSNRYLETM